MAKITALQNGLHSIVQALRAFNTLVENQATDIYALKETIQYAHHGVETLVKYTLLQRNPVFLVQGNQRVQDILPELYKYATGRDRSWSLHTINAKEALDRLHMMFGPLDVFRPGEYDILSSRFDELNTFRNQLEHFAFEGDAKRVSVVVGGVISLFIDILNRLYADDVVSALNKIERRSSEILHRMRTEYHQLYMDALSTLEGFQAEAERMRLEIHCGSRAKRIPIIVIKGQISFDIDYYHIELAIEREGLRKIFREHEDYVLDSIDPRLKDIESYNGRHEIEVVELESTTQLQVGHGDTKQTRHAKNLRHNISINTKAILKNPVNHVSDELKTAVRFMSHLIIETEMKVAITLWELNGMINAFSSEYTNIVVTYSFVPVGEELADVQKHITGRCRAGRVEELKRHYWPDSKMPRIEDLRYELSIDMIGDIGFAPRKDRKPR